MLSYIHAYHAGNHADILKHLTISLILEHLCQKEKPFCVIDTHAGSGIYHLDDERAKKTGEASSGIKKIFNIKKDKDKIECEDFSATFLKTIENLKFFNIIQNFYSHDEYPGSPLIENFFLRKGDEQILSELHPQAFSELQNCFFKQKKFCNENGKIFIEPSLHKRDGYELLNAITPPKIKRGLCVIDPSFEDTSDFEKCGRIISKVHKKWSTGIIALWYPLVAHRFTEISMMKEQISASVEATEPKILNIQMEIKHKEDMKGLASLYGSGMFIVNFPYQLDEQIRRILPKLTNVLGESANKWSVEKFP